MDTFEKIKKLNELQQQIESKERQIYYVERAERLTFTHYVNIRCGESSAKEITFYPSSTLLSNIKEVSIKILKEEIEEMKKEIESILNKN